MLSILLINENKIVSRLFQLSSQKHSYDLEEVSDYSSKENSYNVVFVDSKIYDEEKLGELRKNVSFDKLTYLGDKGTDMPSGFDLMLEKPFLPTDFVNLMNENFKVVEEINDLDIEDEEIEELDELDLDNLDDLELDDEFSLDENDDSDDLNVELDLDNDLQDIPTPKIEEDIKEEAIVDETKEELAEMVAEIDDLDVEEKELELEKDIKVNDPFSDIDELEDDAILSQDLVRESIKEVEEDSNSILESTVAATAAAATVAIASQDEEEVGEALNILDGVESIESEEDYLTDSEQKIDKLADEFDSLNEAEVEKVMSGESLDEIEDVIIDEQIIQDDDKVVEANDLEDMITRAVSKALTKEMIHEALKDMDIVISLKPKDS